MAKLALFICASKDLGSTVIDQRKGVRTCLVPALKCHAYRCKSSAEFNELNATKVRAGKMWAAVMVDDNGVLRHLTDNDEVNESAFVATPFIQPIPVTPEGQVILESASTAVQGPITLNPISHEISPLGVVTATMEDGSVFIGSEQAIRAYGTPATQTVTVEAPADLKPEDEIVASIGTVEPLVEVPFVPAQEAPPPDSPPPAMSHVERIVQSIQNGPKRAGEIATELGIERSDIEALATPEAPFTVSGPAKWVKLKGE